MYLFDTRQCNRALGVGVDDDNVEIIYTITHNTFPNVLYNTLILRRRRREKIVISQ